MGNAIIESQKRLLESVENPNPAPVPADLQPQDPSAPSTAQAPVVPGQEPPAAPVVEAALETPAPALATPPSPQPAPAPDDLEALKRQIADLLGQVEHFKSLYDTRQANMIAPLQRKVSELERQNQDLNRQLQGSAVQVPGAPTAPATPAPAPTPTPQDPEDPKLKEFLDVYEDMIPGLKAFLSKELQPVMQKVKPAVDLAEKQTQADGLGTHLQPLFAKHPQAGNTLRTKEFADWVEAKPPYARQAIVDKVSHPEFYPVEEIISIFDDYGTSRTAPPAPQPPPAPQVQPSPGLMAVEPRRVPTSATPGGAPDPQPLTRERLTFINRALTTDRKLYNDEQIASLRAELNAAENASNSMGMGLVPRLETLSRQPY